MGKVLLVDGHSIINRAFYGVPDLTNVNGLHTNAVYGFLNILFKTMEDEKPTHLAVAFDVHHPTFRHEMYPEYKGTRHPIPDELREQVPVLKELLQAMNIPIMERPGLEADDILGTMAKNAQKNGFDAVILSGDRDLLQIADERIKIRIPKTKGGKTEVEEYMPRDVEEKYGVSPLAFIDVKALMGDSSDNIPGVPKVGEKTAISLVQEFGSIDGIYENIEKVSKPAIRTSLEENKELAIFCRKLVTIVTDAELPFTLDEMTIGNFYNPNSYARIKELELKSFYTKFDAADTGKKKETSSLVFPSYKEACEEIGKLFTKDRVGIYFVFGKEDGETTSDTVGEQLSLFDFGAAEKPAKKKHILAAGISDGENNIGFAVKDAAEQEELLSVLKAYTKAGNKIVVENVKQYYKDFCDKNVAEAKDASGLFEDVIIGAYLLNPLKGDYDVHAVIDEYADPDFTPFVIRFGKKTTEELLKDNFEEFASYLAQLSGGIYASAKAIDEKLADYGMKELYETLEMPLSFVLYEMEQEGIRILPNELREYGENLEVRIEELKNAIHRAAGEEFNINSPKQLADILFEKLKLPGGKKTKTGYSTAVDVLEKLAPEHEIVAQILEYRGLSKLKSTYADGLATQIGEDGRIHTTFQQTVTATGRLSSTEPNLQNIPIRMELGRLIRKVFVPKEGSLFMDADYSQIELRILAHLSKDEQLIEAYNSNADIHAITASKVFHVPFEEVTPLLRRRAKAVNFGIVYGISSFGLSQDLNLSKKEAQGYIDEYFLTYPGIKSFLDGAVESAKNTGYSVTLYNRRRPIPELKSSNFMQRSFGERVAMNAPIQGTAADIMKIAMLHVRDALAKADLKSRILIQVHDELLLEVREEECETVQKILQSEMENAANLAVKLEVDLHTGKTWYDAK